MMKDIMQNIVQRHAFTNDAEEKKKDGFYQQHQTVINKRGPNDVTILMGDLNVKIGADNTGYENIMGNHGSEQMNENGERFACRPMHTEPASDWKKHLPTKAHPQGHVEIPKPYHGEPY
jgi:endonuclease/exonuclease/phosphatase family metal-dependent hydrolase